MSRRMRRGTSSKLSQNRSTIAAIIRLSAVGPGRFSRRLMVGCEHRSSPVSGKRPTAILKAGSDLTVVAVEIPRCDQQRAVSDYLGKLVHDPIGIAPTHPSRQTFGVYTT